MGTFVRILCTFFSKFLLKNFIFFGAIASSKDITYVSNNGLLGLEGDFIKILKTKGCQCTVLGAKYVLPFINTGVSYRHNAVKAYTTPLG